MKDIFITAISPIICFAITGATIVGWAYVAYNPKICPAAVVEEMPGYGDNR